MSPRKCTIEGCSSVSGQNDEHQNVTFHVFPANAATRKTWTENCRIPQNKNITKSTYVCSRHFRRIDFQPLKKDKYFLKQGAVPTIFPWGTPHQSETTASNSSDSNQTNDAAEPTTDDSAAIKPLSAIKADKFSTSKQRSVSADEHLAVSHTAEDKTVPRKSLDSASTIKKDSGKVDVTASASTDGALSKKKMDFVSTLATGMKLEAQDFNKVWHVAKIVEVDHGEKEVLVHFEKNAKAKGSAAISDEWIPMNSSRLRPIEAANVDSTPGVSFKVGDRCMARWTDSRKWPGVVQRVLEKDLHGHEWYQVLYDDGCMKDVQGSHMKHRPATPVSAPLSTVVETAAATPPTPQTPLPKKPLKAHPIPKFDLSALNLPPIPADGEWCCQWVNDTPIGREGYLSNADGNKRPTVLVDDWRLPAGWTKHLYQRSSVSCKWDVVLVGPSNKRFRSKNDVKVYLEEHGQTYNPDVYDFSIHKRRAKDLGVYVFTDGYVSPKIPKPSLDYSNVEISTKALDSSLEGKQEPFTGFTPIESTSASISLPPSLNSSLNLNASLVSSTPVLAAYPKLEEGYIHVGALKVQFINNLYRCPKEGCNKNFRKENHLQIHVKHYHDELSKQLGACPNMTELAYIRTVGTSVDETAPKLAGVALQQNADTPLKQHRGSPIIQVKAEIKEEPIATPTAIVPIQEPRINEMLKRKCDTDIKNDDLKEKKPALPGDIIGITSSTSPQSKLITSVVSPVPSASELIEKKLPQTPVHNIKTSSKLPNVPLRKFKIRKPSKKPGRRKGSTNLSKLKKFKRDFLNSTAMMFKDRNLGLNAPQQSIPDRSSMVPVQLSGEPPLKSQRLKYFQHQSLDSSKVSGLVSLGDGSIHPQTQRYINENGEVIKIVRMRQEEIINCLCTFGEEDGLMIQCELCLCWQHGACNNIEKESQVPEKYVCYICRHPTLGRKSMKYIHDQEWLYEGRLFHSNYHLPSKYSVQRFDVLKQSHTLLGNMLELKKSLHSLNVKINIAANKDHPKMYLWSKPWDETPANNYRQLTNEMGQDQVVPKSEQINQNDPFGNQGAGGKQNEQQAIKTNEIDTERSILNNLLTLDEGGVGGNAGNQSAQAGIKSETAPIIRPNIPEPEAAIDSLECQRRLLDHIQKQQNLIMSRMQMIDAQIIALEAMDEHSNIYPDVNNSKTTSTIQMLLDNLAKLQKLCVINQSTATIPASFQPAI